MTLLSKTVVRRTSDRVFERSRKRGVIVSLEPPNVLSFRLEGTQRKFSLTAEACYQLAVRAEVESRRVAKKKR